MSLTLLLGSLPLACDHLRIPRKPLLFCFADILVLCRILWMELLNRESFSPCSVTFEIIVLNTLLLDLSTAICFLPSEKCTNCVGCCRLLVIFLRVDAGLCWVRLSERKLIGMSEWSTGVSHLSGWPNTIAHGVLTVVQLGSPCTSPSQYLGLTSSLSLPLLVGVCIITSWLQRVCRSVP